MTLTGFGHLLLLPRVLKLEAMEIPTVSRCMVSCYSLINGLVISQMSFFFLPSNHLQSRLGRVNTSSSTVSAI